MKRHSKKRRGFSAKIKVDLSGWELGEWPSYLANSMKVNVSKRPFGVSLEMTAAAFDVAARKIAEEAVEAFFDGLWIEAVPCGVRLADLESDRPIEILIPWPELWTSLDNKRHDETIAAVRTWMDAAEIKHKEESE